MLHAHTSLEGFAMSEKAGTAILRVLGMGIAFVPEVLDTPKKSGWHRGGLTINYCGCSFAREQ